MSRPIPDRLIKALAEAPLLPAHEVDFQARHIARTGQRIATALTDKQRECLEMLAGGLAPIQIAAQLGLHKDTIKLRMRGARIRLGAVNSIHAVAIAVREGEID